MITVLNEKETIVANVLLEALSLRGEPPTIVGSVAINALAIVQGVDVYSETRDYPLSDLASKDIDVLIPPVTMTTRIVKTIIETACMLDGVIVSVSGRGSDHGLEYDDLPITRRLKISGTGIRDFDLLFISLDEGEDFRNTWAASCDYELSAVNMIPLSFRQGCAVSSKAITAERAESLARVAIQRINSGARMRSLTPHEEKTKQRAQKIIKSLA